MNLTDRKLRIADIRVTPVSVPTLRPQAWSLGSSSGTTKSIIELVSDDGMVGLGETPGVRTVDILSGRLREKLIGANVLDRRALGLAVMGKHQDHGSMSDSGAITAFAGLEMALLDLTGKAFGVPVHRLLGAATGAFVPFVSYAYTADESEGHRETEVPTLIADIARRDVAIEGTEFFEFKVGRFSVDCDIATVHAVREAVGPHIAIGVDANMSYTLDQARRFLRGVARAGLANIEEPVEGLTVMETLRREFAVPISTHCTDCDTLRHYPLIDGVVGDFHTNGGIEGNLRKAAAIAGLGKRYWLSSCRELGIAWSAMCHCAAVAAEIQRPSQALITWIEDDLIEGEPWLVRSGGVRLPDTPGLGITLDSAALTRYNAHYEQVGEYTYYDRP